MKLSKNLSITLTIALVLPVFFTGNIKAQDDQDTMHLFTYFHNMGDEIPVVKIMTDYGRLIKKKSKEEYQPAHVSFVGRDGSEQTFDVKVRARGNVRKQVCHIPPVKINFKKGELRDAGFTGMDDIKMVLQCRSGDGNIKYMLRERLIYDLYKVIDPNGVQAQLIDFEFWEDDELKEELRGFFVEDEDHMQSRLEAKILESGNIRSSSLQRDHYLKMSFFQYMISNTDWAIPNKHNVEIVKLHEYPRLVAIPYDFDYSGFVGTSYSVPAPSLPIENVQQRYYMGFKVNSDEALQTAELFKEYKDKFIAVCESSTYIDDDIRKDAINHIEKFYKVLESDKKIKRAFVTMNR